MSAYKISFTPKVRIDFSDEILEPIWDYLGCLYKNGQILKNFELVESDAGSDCARLQNTAFYALKRFKDRRVHDMAVKLIVAGNLDAGLPLLINNWLKQDETLIRERILTSKKISHSLQQGLRVFYSQHRSKSCAGILEHAYRNGECTYCRWGIVKAMWKSRVLKTSIVNECHYDSYDETRKMAGRIGRFVNRQS